MMRRRHRREAGFTLIEVLVAVAIVAILAAVALPSFFRTSNKAKGRSEVVAVFTEMRIRLEQFATENNTFPMNIGEGTMHPAGLPTSTAVAFAPMPMAWTNARILTGPETVYCRYTWVTGLGGQAGNIGAQGTAFGFTAPVADWFYLLARCNFDDNGAVDSFFFTSSTDPEVRVLNEGR